MNAILTSGARNAAPGPNMQVKEIELTGGSGVSTEALLVQWMEGALRAERDCLQQVDWALVSRGGRMFRSPIAAHGQKPLELFSDSGSRVVTERELRRLLQALLAQAPIRMYRSSTLFRQRFIQDPDRQMAVYGFYESRIIGRPAWIHSAGRERRSLLILLPAEALGLCVCVETADEQDTFRALSRLVQHAGAEKE